VVGPPSPYYIWVDDCYVDFGWVFDNRTPQTYRHIAGVRVNCSSRHSVIDATVAMYYSNGSSWVQYGSGLPTPNRRPKIPLVAADSALRPGGCGIRGGIPRGCRTRLSCLPDPP
jgi:hypothetical protein